MHDPRADVLAAQIHADGPAAEVVPETAREESAAPRGVGAGAPEAAELMARIEALVVTSGRAVSAARLAVGLGLVRAEEAEAAAAVAAAEAPGGATAGGATPGGATAGGAGEAAESAVEAKPKRRGRRVTPMAQAERAIGEAVKGLNEVYARTGRAFRIEQVAGGYRLMTLPEHGAAIAAFQGVQERSKLSRAAIETLAIIAYKQPVTRAGLEAIRGVACGEVLKTLLERNLVTIAGRAEELGRPMLYATSKAFLEAFGLASLKDLPTVPEAGGRG